MLEITPSTKPEHGLSPVTQGESGIDSKNILPLPNILPTYQILRAPIRMAMFNSFLLISSLFLQQTSVSKRKEWINLKK